jgi:DNA-binding NarL/FixJ family response regulator
MRIGIVDDAVLFREGLARLVAELGFEVAFQAGTIDELFTELAADQPDAVILDVRLPPSFTNEGIVAARRLRAEHPGVGVLVLSQYVEGSQAARLLADGARGVGYLLKDRVADLATLADAIQRVTAGGTVIDPEVVSRLLSRGRDRDVLDDLTPREREVLRLMAEGHSNGAICEQLTISHKTVETHIGTIFSKLDLLPDQELDRRVHAVLTYLRGTS